MEIRGPGDSLPIRPAGKAPVSGGAVPAGGGAASGGRASDTFSQGPPPDPDDTPFWLITMSADRAAGRQFLDEPDRRRARAAERAWLAAWAAAATRPAPPPSGAAGKPGLEGWQALVTDLCARAGAPIGAPRVVWQRELGPQAPLRGQYLFRVDRGLLQLRPGAPGDGAAWVATVAHETFHHAQHALVVALYRGSPALEPPFDLLASYYRDARIAYRLPGPGLSAAAHARQDLEVGAWAFGEALARRLEKG